MNQPTQFEIELRYPRAPFIVKVAWQKLTHRIVQHYNGEFVHGAFGDFEQYSWRRYDDALKAARLLKWFCRRHGGYVFGVQEGKCGISEFYRVEGKWVEEA